MRWCICPISGIDGKRYPASSVAPMVLRSLAGAFTTDSLIICNNRLPEQVKKLLNAASVEEELERRKAYQVRLLKSASRTPGDYFKNPLQENV